MEAGGRGLKRLLKTLDDEQIDLDQNINSNVANVNNQYNLYNNVPQFNVINNVSGNLPAPPLRNLQPARQENSETTFLSFSLTRQYILYDVYGKGQDRKLAKLSIGQSPYTLEGESQQTQSSEEIDADIDKIKELFAAGFIQQEEYISRTCALQTRKDSVMAN